MRILSWNVNGIRAVERRGLLEWLYRESPDILCVQEMKAHPEQLSGELRQPRDHHTYWSYPKKKGYSGVATFTKEKPVDIHYDLASAGLDVEGRIITVEYPDFILLKVIFP